MARTYKIRDNTTGQMTDIPEEQLTQYGLSTSTTMPQISQTVPNYNQESKPSVADFGVGGLPKSYEDRKRQDLLNDINTTGGKRKDVINNFYDTYKVSDETIAGLKEQELKDNFNKQHVENAKLILDLIQKKMSGQIDESLYQSQLNQLASKESAHIGFGIAGKVLSEAEKTILQPQMANFEKSKTVSKGDIIKRGLGFVTGSGVPEVEKTKEKLNETQSSLSNKMVSIIETFGSEEDKKKYASMRNTLDSNEGFMQGFKGNPIENGINEGIDMARGIGEFMTTKHEGIGPLSAFDLTKTVPAALEMGKGAVKATAATFGLHQDDNGKVQFSPFSGEHGILQHAWNKPVETLSVVGPPFLPSAIRRLAGKGDVPGKFAQATRRAVGKGAKNIAEGATEGLTGGGTKKFITENVNLDEAQSMSKELQKRNILSNITGKGKIIATEKALVDVGQRLGKTFKGSKEVEVGNVLGTELENHLVKTHGGDAVVKKAIISVKNKIIDQGVYDISRNDGVLSMDDLWSLSKDAGKYKARAFNLPNNGPLMSDIAATTERFLRDRLYSKVKEATPDLRSYHALRTYMDDVLTDPKGLDLNSVNKVLGFITGNAKNIGTYGLQKLHNVGEKLAPSAERVVEKSPSATMKFAGGKPIFNKPPEGVSSPLKDAKSVDFKGVSLKRDMRTKQGNVRFKGGEDIFKKNNPARYKTNP